MEKDGALEQRIEENEKYLLNLWAEILAAETISADSDFFQLGGDSIQMMTMLFRVSQDLGVDLSPGAIFETPTPAQLALSLANAQMNCPDELNGGML
jgi:acyl carrier protein